DRLFSCSIHLEITDIHVDDRYKRVLWMDYDGNSCRKKIIGISFKRFFYNIWKLSMDRREIYAAFFNHASPLYDPGTAAAAAFPLPQLFFKFCFSVCFFKSAADLILYLPVFFGN